MTMAAGDWIVLMGTVLAFVFVFCVLACVLSDWVDMDARIVRWRIHRYVTNHKEQ
jgi:hypothetical protein